MPLTLPNLDDVTWDQLMGEARALLPAFSPSWTNFNPSDPGITLLELLAHLTEQMLYRANRIGEEHTLLFLRLLHGSSWSPTRPLQEEVRLALDQLNVPARAVTTNDFESIAVAAASAAALDDAEAQPRARCLSNCNLRDTGTPGDGEAPGHVSVVLLPAVGREPSAALLRRVKHSLEAARLLTTHVHVVAPRFLGFSLRITLVLDNTVAFEWTRAIVANRLQDFFDPHIGGPEGEGWPFGRDIYVSDLYAVLGRINGVEYAMRTREEGTGEDQDEFRVVEEERHRLIRNDRTHLVRIELKQNELPALEFRTEDITLQRRDGEL
jgi:hypothetical protein